ncbi:beta-N-acetylhexosaminidase [Pedobacter nutrimenti]|uniref:beta-N-acetylhexosaminidase n=1 Tax=Pedobacter nutrimenti TaxID=1241337 RepID=UPI002930911D|nr:beta-N-acetylhexosaminidase [Pedobacter nutrimenti]
MLRVSFFCLFLLYATCLQAQNYAKDSTVPGLIPMPDQFQPGRGVFRFSNETPVILNNASADKIAWYLKTEVLKTTGIALRNGEKTMGPGIFLNLKYKKSDLEESYHLIIETNQIVIQASSEKGLFYGVVSFLQILRTAKIKHGIAEISGCKIADAPAYAWRGLMLDESRHFFGKEKVKEILDWMAFYKLNRLHWHLTDEPAWRLEIKKYPNLSLIGGIGNYLNENAPAKYYSQEDIKEIIAYAAERFIEIIPEIDMPGHATAANRAYPEYSGGGTPEHPEFTFNPGLEKTYGYLTDILKETSVLFPSKMIHLGGDEVSFGNEKWKSNTDIISLMRAKNLKDVKEVEDYFMKRMADSVFHLNSKLLVWDEMANAGLPTEKTIMFWWRHDQPRQLRTLMEKGYKTVLCPRLPLYFDFVQDSTHRYGRKWNKLYSPMEDVYNFNAAGFVGKAQELNLIEGIQGNLWTETVPDQMRLDFLLFPRLAALAESAWTKQKNKNLEAFKSRLKSHINLYNQAGLYYYDPFQPGQHPETPVKRKKPLNYKD